MNAFLNAFKFKKRIHGQSAMMMSGAALTHFLLLFVYYEKQPDPTINIIAGGFLFAYPSFWISTNIKILERNIQKINDAERNGTFTASQAHTLRDRYHKVHAESSGTEDSKWSFRSAFFSLLWLGLVILVLVTWIFKFG